MAIATSAPGPDVLDVYVHDAATGWPALRRIRETGVLPVGAPVVRTPSVVNRRFGALFVVCDESCWREPCSLIPCYQLFVIDVMERCLLQRRVDDVNGLPRREAASSSPGRER